MPGKSDKKSQETRKEKEICFKCKFCGEVKPLSDLVILNQYYPPRSACKLCATGPKGPEKDDDNSDT